MKNKKMDKLKIYLDAIKSIELHKFQNINGEPDESLSDETKHRILSNITGVSLRKKKSKRLYKIGAIAAILAMLIGLLNVSAVRVVLYKFVCETGRIFFGEDNGTVFEMTDSTQVYALAKETFLGILYFPDAEDELPENLILQDSRIKENEIIFSYASEDGAFTLELVETVNTGQGSIGIYEDNSFYSEKNIGGHKINICGVTNDNQVNFYSAYWNIEDTVYTIETNLSEQQMLSFIQLLLDQ